MKLLDYIKEKFELKNDAAISRVLEIAPPVVSKLRNGRITASAEIILKIHEKLDIPVKDIRSML